MQICTSLQTDNHASTSLLGFLQAGCPSCRPTNSVKALKAQAIYCSKVQKRNLKEIRNSLSFASFNRNLKTYYFSQAFS